MPYDIVLASAVRTSTGSSANLAYPKEAWLRVELNVSASSAPTTLDVSVQHSNDGGTTWVTLGSFTEVGAVSTASQSIAIAPPTSGLVKVIWTAVGTSYTFSVTIRSTTM
jgi:hypothetical protein